MAQAQLVQYSEDQQAEVLAAKTRGGAKEIFQVCEINGNVVYDSRNKTETFDIVAAGMGPDKTVQRWKFVGTANVCTPGQAPETPIKGVMTVQGYFKPGPEAFMCRGTKEGLFMTFYTGLPDKWLVANHVPGFDDGKPYLGNGEWVALLA